MILEILEAFFPVLVQYLANMSNQNCCGCLQIMKINGVFNSIIICIQKLGVKCLKNTIDRFNDNVNNHNYKSTNDDAADHIMIAIWKILENNQELAMYNEAFNCIGVVASCVQDDFWKYLATPQIQSLLLKMLAELSSNNSNVELNESIVGTIGDIFRACQHCLSKEHHKTQDFCDKAVNILLMLTISDKVEIESKPHIIDTLADICVGLGIHSARYLQYILSKCLDLGCQSIQTEDEDILKQINLIRKSIVDVCSIALTIFSENEKFDHFLVLTPKIIQMLQNIVNSGMCNKVKLLSCCDRFLIILKDVKDIRIRESFRNETINSLLQLSKNGNQQLFQEA